VSANLRLRGRPWIWPTLLSIDAPVVAVLWLGLFARSLELRVPTDVMVVLALAVWLIYVADRILDSYREGDETPLALRHRFYRAHRRLFALPFFAILLLTAWMACTQLDHRILRNGFILALIVGAYFLVVHAAGAMARAWFPKELAVALLFAAGTCLPLWTWLRGAPELAALAGFVLVAWMNTVLIEYSEWMGMREGASQRPHSLTIAIGKHIVLFGVVVAALALGALAASGFSNLRSVLLAEAASALILCALGLRWRKISSYALRIAADVALCTPAVLLVVWRR
jgi:hypothetical protein